MSKTLNPRIALIYSTLIVLISLIFSGGISGNDFWWHVKAGEWMFIHQQIPYTDIFSWYGIQETLTWLSHEWLSEIILYLIYHSFRETGIFTFCILSLSLLTFLFINYGNNKKYITHSFIHSLLFLILSTIVMSFYFYGRPHLFSFFLLFSTLYCLYKFKNNENAKTIYLLPLITILWSSLHGGSAQLVYMLCFLFLLSGLFTKKIGKITFLKHSKKQLKLFAIMGFLSLLSICINPHGISLLLYPFENMSNPLFMSTINEWSAPDAKILWQFVACFIPLFLIFIAFLTTEKDIDSIDLILFCFFIVLFFRSQRFIALFFISANFYAYKYFIQSNLSATNKKFNYLVIFLLLSVTMFNFIKLKYDNVPLISNVLPADFVAYIRAENPQRLCNDYNLGETLIFENIKVFVDGRADLYANKNFYDYMALTNLKNIDKKNLFDPEPIIKKYNFDSFLLLNIRPLNVYLRNNPDKYELIKSTDTISFYRVKNKQ